MPIWPISGPQEYTKRAENEIPDMSYEEYEKERGKKIPLGRMGDAEEYANMACFLASDAASGIAGGAINIDEGMSPVVHP